MVEKTANDCSNVVTQILLSGAREILGKEKLRQTLGELSPSSRASQGRQEDMGFSLPLGEAGALLRMLEGIYGISGGRGLALRIGRSAFKYGLQIFGDQAGFRAAEFRLLPAPRRIETGLKVLARIIAEECADEITVVDAGSYWLWRSEHCPLCQNHLSADPCCYLTVGLLQEFTAWAGGGRFYPVTEMECRASGGSACVFRIEKRPLD